MSVAPGVDFRVDMSVGVTIDATFNLYDDPASLYGLKWWENTGNAGGFNAAQNFDFPVVQLEDGFTLSVVFKLDAWTGVMRVVNTWAGDAADRSMAVSISDSQECVFQVETSDGTFTVVGPVIPADGVSHEVAAKYDPAAGLILLWVDRVLFSAPVTGVLNTAVFPLTVGQRADLAAPGEAFTGRVFRCEVVTAAGWKTDLNMDAAPTGPADGAVWSDSSFVHQWTGAGPDAEIVEAVAAVYSGADFNWTPVPDVRVEAFTFTRGRDSYTSDFSPGSGALTLVNDDGLFNPSLGNVNIGGRGLRPGRWVRLRAKLSADPDSPSSWVPLFVGRIDQISDVYRDAAYRITSKLQMTDLLSWLAQQNPPPLPESEHIPQGQRTDERVRFIWEEQIGFPGELLTADVGSHNMARSVLPDSYLREMRKAAEAEGGAFYMGKDGYPRFRSRNWLFDGPNEGTVQFGVGDNLVDDIQVIDARTQWELTRVRNDIQYTRVSNDPPDTDPPVDVPVLQRAVNLASRGLYGGLRSLENHQLECETDAEAAELANDTLLFLSWDRLRLRELSVVALNAVGARQLLDVDVGWRIRATIRTGQGWSYATDVWVNRITMDVTPDDWSVRLMVDDVDLSSPVTGGPYSLAYSDAFDTVE